MADRANASYLEEKDDGPTKNYTMLQAFEWFTPGGGKHWRELTDKVEELADIGITAMWIPPPTKASTPEGVGYDIYDLWDLGEFDTKAGVATKWGTKDELVNLTKTAKKNGIIDAVLNHKAAADHTEKTTVKEVDPEDRNEETSDAYEIESWTGFNFPARGDKYSDMKWHQHHFTGVDYDDKSKRSAIFKIQGDGKSWSKKVDKEKGNFDYLMFADLDHSHPEVSDECKKWGVWVLKELGASGFRFDAVKHIDRAFIGDFVRHVRKEMGNPDLFAVGEFWKEDMGALESYLDGVKCQFSVFDAPLHYNFKEAADASTDYDLRKIFDNTIVQQRPIDAVTLVDNHDTQPYEALESWVAPQFKPIAYAFILLRPDGYPCVFWGDLVGISGEHTFPPVNQLADIIRARKFFAFGELRDYWDHANCVGWVRDGDDYHDGCAVVVCNGTGDGEKRMEVGKKHGGEKWTDVLGWHKDEVTIDEEGWGTFKSPPTSISIWAKTDARGRDQFKN